MKQHITIEQWEDLSDKQQKNLQEWWKLRTPPILSIGQMIEFLDSHQQHISITIGIGIHITKPFGNMSETKGVSDLCDALWEAVKEVL